MLKLLKFPMLNFPIMARSSVDLQCAMLDLAMMVSSRLSLQESSMF